MVRVPSLLRLPLLALLPLLPFGASYVACANFASSEVAPVAVDGATPVADGAPPPDALALSDANPEDAGPPEPPDAEPPEAGPVAKRVFVTNLPYEGVFLSGRAAADTICSNEATTAGLRGKWVAYLSISAENALNRLPVNGVWSSLSPQLGQAGDVVFASRSAIPNGPAYPIDRSASGAPPTESSTAVWTGTLGDGRADLDGGTCGDWTAAEAYGRIGAWSASGDAGTWSSTETPQCLKPAHFYCFEI